MSDIGPIYRDFRAAVSLLVEEALEAERAAIEEACERSLTDPRGWGVKVDRCGAQVSVYLSPHVPYGNIHEQRIAQTATWEVDEWLAHNRE